MAETDEGIVDQRVFDVVNTEPQPKLRSVKEIAGRLSLDHQEVFLALRRLQAAGRIKGDLRKNGLETWRTDATPPKPPKAAKAPKAPKAGPQA